jgi:probable phosphoglycerate mutase
LSAARIILIRHAETPWNRERRMQGHMNTPLSEAGRAQAVALGRRLVGHPFRALYSSDLARAHQTAQAIADHCGCEVLSDVRLRERSFGIFEGLTYAEMAERHPEDFARFDSRDPDYILPGGESGRMFWERCLACLAEIGEQHAGDEVVVVTHGLVLDAVYRKAHGLAHYEPRPVPLVNASINAFDYAGGAWRMESWGDVAHLAPELVTRYEGRVR